MKSKIIVMIVILFLIIGSLIYIKTTTEKNSKNDLELENETSKKSNYIFEEYYDKAENKLKELSIDEKIGQLFLARFPTRNVEEDIKKYKLGGYILFEKDFKGKTEKEIKDTIHKLQKVSNIPLLIAVDEEGGTVVRVSSNKNLAVSRFKSPMELYNLGGFNKIKEDTIEKSKVLSNLGINLNLAPVVDVSTDKNDYIYERTLGQNVNLTSSYARIVINSSKNTNVSYTLKHFPGYGNNVDTHKGSSVDKRTYEQIINNDLLPFKAGIEEGAEAILISHNIVTSIDEKEPASLSKKVHQLLTDELKFSGVVITDDLSMEAVSEDKNAVIKAILAGNNIIISSEYGRSIEEVKQAVKQGKIKEKTIDELILKVIAWKYYKNLL